MRANVSNARRQRKQELEACRKPPPPRHAVEEHHGERPCFNCNASAGATPVGQARATDSRKNPSAEEAKEKALKKEE